jgi:hypothetical protein
MSLPNFREPLLIEIELARQINVAVYEMLPCANGGDERADLSSALAHIALEHIGSILSLFANGAFASGYALMRPALETTYRCVWIAQVADDAKVAKAFMGRDVYGDLKDVIGDIETRFAGNGWAPTFSRIRPHIRALHERTHSGREQTLRRLRAQDMSMPEYDFAELVRDIRTLAAAAILVVIPIADQEDVGKLNALMIANYSCAGGNNAV